MIQTTELCHVDTCARPGCSREAGCQGHAWREIAPEHYRQRLQKLLDDAAKDAVTLDNQLHEAGRQLGMEQARAELAKTCEVVADPMSAKRAAFFMERFKRDEKLLGPNEQAAVAFVIAMLEREAATPQPAAERVAPLTDAQIEKGREDTFSTNNPFCPCDSKTMRKAVRWAERAHGIGTTEQAKEQR